jgi:RNA polymerase sigma factor (TIGR02999 family)
MANPNHSSDAPSGDPRGVADLLPLLYDELRALAAAQLAAEPAGHTLQPTALVHEAYLRLAGRPEFPGRSHFLAAAGEAMRRLLIDHARKKRASKRGGDARRVALDPDQLPGRPLDPDDLMAVDEALTRFAATDPTAARLAALRLFAGLSVEEAGDALGLPRASAYRDWAYARAWLSAALSENPAES